MSSQPNRELSGHRAAVLSLLLVALVFAVDLCLPLGVASAVPYTFAVLLALKAPSRWFAPGVAALCGVLTVLKMGLLPERGTTELWKVVVNRCLALFSIGMTTFLGVMRRRSEAKRRDAEGRLRQHLADLAHMGRLKTAGQLAAGLAHELNQPLAAVCLQAAVAERIAADGGGRDELLTSMREVVEQSQRAADIVRTLRRMVRRTEPGQAPVDVNEVVRAVARLIDWEARRAGVELRLQLAEAPPSVLGDLIQLEQVVFNLLQNAIEAVAEAGPGPKVVRVETAVGDEDRVTVAVCDSGVGFPPDGAERVFERFYTTKPNGMGMGLAISRSIVEAHGGRLWAVSHPARGAAFTFSLPIARGS